MSKTTWILVANRAGARLFENTGPGQGLSFKQEFPHTEGRLKNQEIISDRQGQAADTRGGGHHSYENAVEPVEHLAQQFAKYLAQQLEHGRTEKRYEQLILVAEPRFLGHLRAVLSGPLLAMVIASVDKDLGDIEARDLAGHIDRVVRV
jgi:protein required for attachment to host cells